MINISSGTNYNNHSNKIAFKSITKYVVDYRNVEKAIETFINPRIGSNGCQAFFESPYYSHLVNFKISIKNKLDWAYNYLELRGIKLEKPEYLKTEKFSLFIIDGDDNKPFNKYFDNSKAKKIGLKAAVQAMKLKLLDINEAQDLFMHNEINRLYTEELNKYLKNKKVEIIHWQPE